MNDRKEPLKLEAGIPETLKLVSTVPFWNGTDNFGKPKYGYKIMHVSGKDAMFVSDKVKLIIDTSGVKAENEFIILLDQGKTSDGQPINFWTLDRKDGNGAKTANQWAEFESPAAVVDPPSPAPATPRHDNRHENLFEVADQVKALEIRVTKLESKLNKTNEAATPTDGVGDLPF